MNHCWSPVPWTGFFLTFVPYIIKTESISAPDEKIASTQLTDFKSSAKIKNVSIPEQKYSSNVNISALQKNFYTNNAKPSSSEAKRISNVSSGHPASVASPHISNAKLPYSMLHISNTNKMASPHSSSHPANSIKPTCSNLHPSENNMRPCLKSHSTEQFSSNEPNVTSCCESCGCGCYQSSSTFDASGSEIASAFLHSSFMDMLPEDVSNVIIDSYHQLDENLEGTHNLLEELKKAMKNFIENLFVARGYKEMIECDRIKGNELLPMHIEEYKKYKKIANAYFQKYNHIQSQIDSNIQVLKLPGTSQYDSTIDSELENKTEIDSIFLRSSFLDVLPDNEMISHIYEKLIEEYNNMHTSLEDLKEAMKFFINYIFVARAHKEVIESEIMAENELMPLFIKEYEKCKRNANMYRRKYNTLRSKLELNYVETLKQLQPLETKMQAML